MWEYPILLTRRSVVNTPTISYVYALQICMSQYITIYIMSTIALNSKRYRWTSAQNYIHTLKDAIIQQWWKCIALRFINSTTFLFDMWSSALILFQCIDVIFYKDFNVYSAVISLRILHPIFSEIADWSKHFHGFTLSRTPGCTSQAPGVWYRLIPVYAWDSFLVTSQWAKGVTINRPN